MKLVQKQDQDVNTANGSAVRFEIGKVFFEVRATFGCTVFLERTFNTAHGFLLEKRKPLNWFLNDALDNEHCFRIDVFRTVLESLIINWIGYKEVLPTIKPEELPNLQKTLLLLLSFCLGGADAGKKYLMLLAVENYQQQEHNKELTQAALLTQQKSIKSYTLH